MKDEQKTPAHRVVLQPSRACVTTIHTAGADSSGIPDAPAAEPVANPAEDDAKTLSKPFHKR